MNENELIADDGEDWVEEEMLVYVDFGSSLAATEIDDEDMQFKIVGIEEENPVAEINGKVFKGTHDYAIGTKLFFAENPDHPKSDPVFGKNPEKFYKCIGKTNKIIRMERIFVEPKERPTKESESRESKEQELKYVITETYQEVLDKLLKPGQLPPRTVVTEKLDKKTLSRRELQMEFSHEPR